MADRITELRIEGLRTIEKLTLPQGGLTVLIGDNGSGKSSIIEACQILSSLASSSFLNELHSTHGGPARLLRDNTSELRFGLSVVSDSGQSELTYDIGLLRSDYGFVVDCEELSERTEAGTPATKVLDRLHGISSTWLDRGGNPRTAISAGPPREPLVGTSGPWSTHEAIQRVLGVLAGIEVHMPFEVASLWESRRAQRLSTSRLPVVLQRTDRLEFLARNLPNAFHTLAHDFGEAHWHETLDYVRLGLGYDVERVTTPADAGGGAISVELELQGRRRRPAASLSDGQLAYLAFVALYRLETPRSLLAFDEPDLHLHPGLLVRVMQLFDVMARRHPVLLTTHSDTALDCLADAAQSTRVCELEMPGRRTRLRALDPQALAKWLIDYRGVGHLRGDGYLPLVLKEQ